jgi:hypothetical protein
MRYWYCTGDRPRLVRLKEVRLPVPANELACGAVKDCAVGSDALDWVAVVVKAGGHLVGLETLGIARGDVALEAACKVGAEEGRRAGLGWFEMRGDGGGGWENITWRIVMGMLYVCV